MEDPHMELSEIEEEDQVPEESKMSMILNRGWRLGKKIVITGVAISSAPLVLPPLVVFSTIGFAFALPFGFVFFSYACTQKLMSKLLSRPKPPLMLEYNVDEDDEKFRGQYMDEEEMKFIDDTNEALGMRIELVVDEKEVREEEEGFVVEEEDEEPVINEDMEGVREEEWGDETRFDNYVEDEEIPVEEYLGDIEEEELEGGTEGVMEEFGDEEKIDETQEVEEEEIPIKGNTGDIEVEKKPIGEVREEIREEVNWEKVLEDEKKMVYVNENVGEESINLKNGVKSIGEEVEPVDGSVDKAIEDEKIEEENPVIEINGVVKETRNEGNADILVEEEEKKPVQDMKVRMIGEEIEGENPLEVTVESIVKGKEPRREKEGVVEENIDEGKNIAKDEIPIEEMQQMAGEIVDELNVNDVAQEENYIVIEEERPLEDIVGVAEEERRDNGNYVVNLVVKEGVLDNDNQVKPIHGISGVIEETRDYGNADKSKEELEIPLEETQRVLQEDKSNEETVKNSKESRVPEGVDMAVNEGVKPVEDVGVMLEVTRDEGNVDKVVMVETTGVIDEGIADRVVEDEKKPIMQTEKMVHPSKADDAREIADESGLHLFDEENADADHYTSAINEVHQGVPQEENATIPSNEVMYSEEKIWEQIDAMRKIVGYKAAVQATSIEELKALYVFTGVEPPLTFKDPTDLTEINDKLRILMSIVGVK